MAINYYFNENNKKSTERETTTYKVESPAKKTVDNSDAIMYNKDTKYAPFKTPSTDFASQWKEKNQALSRSQR